MHCVNKIFASCFMFIQMEEIEIPLVRGSMDDIGDEEVRVV